jgi:hypothetical protein
MVVAGAALSIGAQALAQTSQDQNRAYAAELTADAGNRTSLLAAGAGAGRNNGMFFISDGGDNTLNIGGTLQFRYMADFRNKGGLPAPANDNKFTHGFQYNDVRLNAGGTVASKDLSYYIRGNFNRGGFGGFALEEAIGAYSFENGWKVSWGQFVMPVLHERNVGSEMQLAVDRSQVARFFDPDYSQGVQVGYTSEQFRIMGGFTDGVNSSDTGFGSPNNATPLPVAGAFPGGEADFALNARAEFIAMGNSFDRFNDFTSWRNADSTSLMIGVAGAYETGGKTGAAATGTRSTNFLYTVDASVEGPGWNAFGAIVGNYNKPGAGAPKLNDLGWVFQGGVFVAEQWELFGRYDGIRLDNDRLTAAGGGFKRTQHFLTMGANYYISPDSHAAKFTGDVVIALSKTANAGGTVSPGIGGGDAQTGVLGSQKSAEVTFRLQLQLMF